MLLNVSMFQTSLSKVRNVKFQSFLKSWSLNQLDCLVHASFFCRFFQKKFNNRCSCTGHFYRGKWPSYSGKLAWCVWRDCPEINLPWEISMVTSKRRKKPPMTFNVVNSWGLWIPKPNKANQVSSFNTNMKPQKIEFIFRHFWLILPFWAILKK